MPPTFRESSCSSRVPFTFAVWLLSTLTAGDVEAQHRTELRPHPDGDVLRQRQLPAVVIPALIVINALVARFQPVECTSFQKYIGRTMAP